MEQKHDMTGKTVVITGASRGIGAATARHMAALGANVVLAARSRRLVIAAAEQITAAGGHALAVQTDVADFAQVDALMAQAVDHFGTVDVLVNNAGIIDPIARLEESDPDAWGAVTDVNIKGVYHGIRAVLPHMRAQKAGTIINISSGAAHSALEGWSHYCASKAAVYALTRCTHKEVANQGIRVVGLSPGTVATDMQVAIKQSGMNPVSQLDSSAHIPSDWVARAVAYLCTPAAEGYLGTDFSLKTDEGRRAVGLPLLTSP